MTALHTNSPSTLLELSDERDAQLQLRHEAYREGWQDGARDEYSRGYSDAVSDIKAAQHDLVDEVGAELGRWHVCCRPCRLGGHQDGCTQCQNRTRATFADPHPDDYRAGTA